MNDIPPKYDPASDPLLRLAQKISEHLGRIALEHQAQTEHLATLAGILKSKAASDEPAAESEASFGAHAFWTGLRARLTGKEFCGVKAYWPASPPAGFAVIYQDMGAQEIQRVLAAYGAMCDKDESPLNHKHNKRKWWKSGMFKEGSWATIVSQTAPPVERKASMPNVETPAVTAIMEHVRANPDAAATRERVDKEITVQGRTQTMSVVDVGPGLRMLQDSTHDEAALGHQRVAMALRYFMDVWEWSEGGFGDNPPRLERPDLFKEGDERKWPADAERIALEAVRLEVEASENG